VGARNLDLAQERALVALIGRALLTQLKKLFAQIRKSRNPGGLRLFYSKLMFEPEGS
jgi:hypothetical protein